MTLTRLFVFVFISSYSVLLAANQDDTRVLLRRPTFLFDGSQTGKIEFLTDYSARANFGAFVYSDEYHAWRFGIGMDGTILSFGRNAIWRAGANFDALADMQNKNFLFRLGQTHYEVFSALELKLDESIVYLGYRHRCRHGADTTYSRIVMKTGPEIGFNGLFHLGPVEIISSTAFLVYIIGQNEDLSHQPRINLSSTVQAEYQPWERVSIFASVGLSAIWVTKSGYKEYYFLTAPLDHELRFSPGASVGLNFKGRTGEFKTYVAYNSNLDAGFRGQAQRTHLASVNGEFWF